MVEVKICIAGFCQTGKSYLDIQKVLTTDAIQIPLCTVQRTGHPFQVTNSELQKESLPDIK